MTQGMFEIKVGSKYLIRTSEDDDTIGIFEGYAMLGSESAVAWGCDLTYDYVKINGDYRS